MKNLSRYLLLGLTLLVVAFLIFRFIDIVTYVLIAWVLSLIGQPLMRFFQRYLRIGKFRMGPNFSALLTLLCFFIVISLLALLFVPLVLRQAQNLAEVDYAGIARALQEPYQHTLDWLQRRGFEPEQANLEDQLRETLTGRFGPGTVGNFFSGLVATASSAFITIFSIVFITFFFLQDKGLFINFIVALVPARHEERVRSAIQEIVQLLSRYFSGILLQITIITVFVSLLLTLIGVQNAVLIALFAAFVNVIPYLGPLIGAIFGLFITISSNLDLAFYNEMLPLLLKVIAVFAAMQLLDNFILQPFIFSSSVLAHPLEIFIIILMGANLGGILGMVLAIPTYTVLRVVARTFLFRFRIVQKITERMGKG